MGVNLSLIIPRKRVTLRYLKGRCIAFDALNVIYQFLALIRLPDGEPLRDKEGHITSHLVGILNRYTRLMVEYNIKPVFVFDGPPHLLKKKEIERRKSLRDKAFYEWRKALQSGDLEKAFSKAVIAIRVENYMIEDSKRLLELMGIPVIDAVHDAEAQAAYMVSKGDVWTVGTMDYDALLYGALRMTRYITITGFEWLPSKGISRKLFPEIIELENVLRLLGISRRQLVDIAILVGTDYNKGVKGIGPKKALALIRRYKCIEKLSRNIFEKVDKNYSDIRMIFLNPKINKDYTISFKQPDINGLVDFLVYERDFSKKRISNVLERLKKINLSYVQKDINEYFN